MTFIKDIGEENGETKQLQKKKRLGNTKKSKNYDREFYQPDSLNSFRNSWQRYLSENKYPFDIKTGNLFERSKKSLGF